MAELTISKLPSLTPVTVAEHEAILELMPLASDHSLHGDEGADVALRWMRRMQDAFNTHQKEPSDD